MTSVPDLLKPVIDANIEKYGQHVMGVGGHPPFFYTIGNAGQGLPELLVVGGLPPMIGMNLLNQLGDTMRKDGAPLPEGMLDIGWTVDVKIRKASAAAKSEFTIQAGQYFGREDYEVLQILLCDTDGVYQDEPSCDLGMVAV